ncbi:MAG: pantoate--beta-alanine ligase [Verrucomicrobiae bacterium]|nr:pantoate--beta-alanine ligase [Verrucomicrobiae bacterium]
MRIARAIRLLDRALAPARRAGRRVVFVPTMGALHEGHASLIRLARRRAGARGVVVVSVFVNAPQFNQRSDFTKYPRTLAADSVLCRRAGADLLFAPSATDMYPPSHSTWVSEEALSLPLCGARRPGHFRGVCTVVLKLFNLVRPTEAIFGLKDFQQAALLQRMTRDLNVPVRIVCAPVVREADGLAMSSRNRRLTPRGRRLAALLNGALAFARWRFLRGERRPSRLLADARRLLRVPGLRVEYLDLVRSSTLRPSPRATRGDTLALAAWVEGVRLIDNLRL